MSYSATPTAGSSSNPYDDAALARALQEEYEREYRRRSMQQHLNPGAGAQQQPRQSRSSSAAPPPINTTSHHTTNTSTTRNVSNRSSSRGRATAADPIRNSTRSSNNNNHHSRSRSRNRTDVPVRPSAPPAPSSTRSDGFFEEPFYAPAQDNVVYDDPPLFILSGDSFGSIEVSDAAYARQLEMELRREEEAERNREMRKLHLQQQRDSFRANRSTTNSSAGSSSQQPPRTATTMANTTTTTNGLNRANSSSYSSISNTSMLNPPRPMLVQPRDTTTAIPTTNTRSTSAGGGRVVNNNSNSRNNNSRSNDDILFPVVTGTTTAVAAAYNMDDEEYARRLEQEMQDEEFARQAFAEEQIRQSSIQAQAMYSNNNNHRIGEARAANRITTRAAGGSGGRRGCYTLRRCISCCVTLILSIILTALLVYFFFGDDTASNLGWDPKEFGNEDPFNSANKEDANLWKTKGGVGLELGLINALDSNWHDTFDTAVSQWDAGTPDALTLSTEVWEPESVCKPETGKLKVCNGNYGETNWRGINKVLLENGWIYSSAARMNDFYSTDKDVAQKQYTMCHEVGHGFGLPHTDENFFNKDLGNCMDYTNNPENNMQPATANFDFLAQLYGTVDGSPVPPENNGGSNVTDASVTKSASDPNASAAGSTEDDNDWKDIFKNIGNRRRLRRTTAATATSSVQSSMTTSSNSHRRELPPAIAATVNEIDSMIDQGILFGWKTTTTTTPTEQKGGWRRLHSSPHGESHELDLGEGFTVQIHLLR